MTTITAEAASFAPRSRPRTRDARSGQGPNRALRWALAVFFALAGVALILNEQSLRVIEVTMLRGIVGLFAGEATESLVGGQPTIGYTMDGDLYALRVTVQCSIALYIGPVLGLAGVMGLAPGVKLRRIALAVTGGVVALIVLNQLRLTMIAFAFGTWGKEGFSWTHGPIGSILMLLGLGAVLLMFFVLCLSRSARGVARREARR